MDCGWTYLPFSLTQPWIFRDALISKFTARVLSFGFLGQSVNLISCESFPPRLLFLLSSHLLVDLFVPRRREYGQDKHCPGAESDLQETWCVFLFRSLPIKKVSMDLLGSPFARSGRKGKGAGGGSLSYLRGRCSPPTTPCRTSRCGQYHKCAVSVR